MTRRLQQSVEELYLSIRSSNLLRSLNLGTVGAVRRYLKRTTPRTKVGTWQEIAKAISDENLQRLEQLEAEDRQQPHEVVLLLWQVGSDLYPSEREAIQKAQSNKQSSDAWYREHYPDHTPSPYKEPQQRQLRLFTGDWHACDRHVKALKRSGLTEVYMHRDYSRG